MNFHGGIGQIVSRMTHAGTHYALALPLTGDYQRVLRKFRGTLGFQRLALWLFVVHQDGHAERYDADGFTAFVNAL
jgi:hypothetical protein